MKKFWSYAYALPIGAGFMTAFISSAFPQLLTYLEGQGYSRLDLIVITSAAFMMAFTLTLGRHSLFVCLLALASIAVAVPDLGGYAGRALIDQAIDKINPSGSPGDDPTLNKSQISGSGLMRATRETFYLLRQCDEEAILRDRRCGKRPVVIIDAQRMPYIARNITLAWDSGLPKQRESRLHKVSGPEAKNNREQVCPASLSKKWNKIGGSCDEYPFATSAEGGEDDGARARIAMVPMNPPEQQRQGRAIMRGVGGLKDGDEFLVIIIHPEYTAREDFLGVQK